MCNHLRSYRRCPGLRCHCLPSCSRNISGNRRVAYWPVATNISISIDYGRGYYPLAVLYIVIVNRQGILKRCYACFGAVPLHSSSFGIRRGFATSFQGSRAPSEPSGSSPDPCIGSRSCPSVSDFLVLQTHLHSLEPLLGSFEPRRNLAPRRLSSPRSAIIRCALAASAQAVRSSSRKTRRSASSVSGACSGAIAARKAALMSVW